MNNDPRYPIGKFERPAEYNGGDFKKYIATISQHPGKLRQETSKLDDQQLDTPYRDGGWTVRQVVHHIADSHMNAYIRFKLAFTENNPAIKPYLEALWAETSDGRTMPIAVSLKILEAVHERWVHFLGSIEEPDFEKSYFHPESGRDVPLKEALALYAWHCDHHLAHITTLKTRKNWQ